MRAQTDPALPELPPFWHNMGAILRYPLQGAALTLIAAQLLLDREGNAEDARELLKEIAARYPQHPLLPVLRDRLATLDALSQKLAGPH